MSDDFISSFIPSFLAANLFMSFFVIFIISSILFLLTREIVLWYWRINHFYDALKGIDSRLGDIANSIRQSARSSSYENASVLPNAPEISDPKLKEVMEQLKKEQPY